MVPIDTSCERYTMIALLLCLDDLYLACLYVSQARAQSRRVEPQEPQGQRVIDLRLLHDSLQVHSTIVLDLLRGYDARP